MSSDKTTSRFFAFVSCGFAGAVVIGLGVWQLGVVQNGSQTASDAGVVAAITSDSPVPAAMSGTNPGNTPLPVPTPNSSGGNREKKPDNQDDSDNAITQPTEQPNDIKRDPLLPPRAYVAPDRGNQPKNTSGNVNTFVPPITAENVPRVHPAPPPPLLGDTETAPTPSTTTPPTSTTPATTSSSPTTTSSTEAPHKAERERTPEPTQTPSPATTPHPQHAPYSQGVSPGDATNQAYTTMADPQRIDPQL